MKAKFLIASLLVGASITAFAQGYKDGIDFYKIGDYENAKTILDRNINTASNKAEAYYYYGQIAFLEGKLDEAKKYFDMGLATDANYPYNLVGNGAVLLKKGDKSGAEMIFKAARKLTKKDAKLEIAIARAYFAANPTANDKEIQKCIKNARKWAPNDPDAYIFEGDMSETVEDWGNAQGKYEMAMTYDPANIESTVKYADTYYRVNPDLALDRLKGISAANPNSALVQRQLAEKLYDHGDFAEAATTYGKYIGNSQNHFPKDEARYSQLLYFANEFQASYDQAVKLKKSIDSSNPYYIVADRLLLYSLANLGKFEEAAEVGREMFGLKNATNAENYNYKDYVMFAKVLEEAKKPEEAVIYYDKAIEMNPENTELAHSLATQYLGAKNFDKALLYANKVIDAGNASGADYATLASIYYQKAVDSSATEASKAADLASGLAAVEKALQTNPSNMTFLYYKANLQAAGETKNNGAALNTMNQLIAEIKKQEDQKPYYGTLTYAYSYVALYYFGQKDYSKALEYFQAWREIEPNNQGVLDAIKQLSK